MTKKDMKEARYSLQEMIVYLLIIFFAGNSTGAAVFSSRSGSDKATLQRIERKVERLEACVSDLKAQIRDMKIKEDIKKK